LIKIRYIYLIVALVVVIFSLAITAVAFLGESNVKTKHYESNDISFDYPQNWQIIYGLSASEIVSFTDASSDLNVTINKQSIPINYTHPSNFILKSAEAEQSGFKFISHSPLNLNGTEAHENVYQINMNGNTFQITEVWIQKNEALYSIIYTKKLISSTDNPEKDQKFKVLLKTINIKNSATANTNMWGTLSIPTLNSNWNIRTDTLNSYNTVYHAPSFYPGENGTVGISGHHTKYSAPFARINLLKVGDQVIINDYLTQKKFIYEVMNNGDIKWDYKTNPVQFPAGNSELTLITCYPPGFTEAAWMVHCKLKSVQPL
jgi:sortase A